MVTSSSFNKLKELVDSDQFCSGKVCVESYSTAWVARIKDFNDNGRPAFPKCLEWVRTHQLKDGSWGSKYPDLIFEKITSTLICIICLKEWALEKDSQLVERGFSFVRDNLKFIGNYKDVQDYMTVGFELILPVLIDQARSMGMEFGQEQIVEQYRDERNRKIKKIIEWEKGNKKLPGNCTGRFTIEALGTLYSNEEIFEMVSQNGLICDSYGATAYMLFRGIKNEQSYQHINKVALENDHGIPPFDKVEIFEISWSINTLIIAGYNMIDDSLIRKVDILEKLWIKSKGMLGGSINLPPDADDISSTILALTSTGRLSAVESLNTLLKYFLNNYFITYQTEGTPSLSTNINCLITLKKYNHFPEVQEIINKLYEWTKSKIIDSDFQFMDKWHISSLYSMSRALLAFDCIDQVLCEQIYQMLLDKQNEDGGWGSLGRSTYLESSYVVIMVNHYLSNNPHVKSKQAMFAFNNVRKFMENYVDEIIPLWTAKSLYSAIFLDKTTILAAKFVLDQILK